MLRTIFLATTLIAPWLFTPALADDPLSLQESLQVIQQVGPRGQGHAAAAKALESLSKSEASLVPEILGGMTKNNVLANNWIRGAVESIIDRSVKAGRPLQLAGLNQFLTNTSHAPRGRELAFQIITQAKPDSRDALLAKMLDDPSLELRREAIATALNSADKLAAGENKAAAISAYEKLLTNARDNDQIDSLAKKLRDLDQKVDLAAHFGFVLEWNLIAPFENTQKSGFDKAYPPEESIDLQETYQGKDGLTTKWIVHKTDDEYGLVDLAAVLGKHKGAVAYAYTKFTANKECDADFRLGCINANKVWVNGKLVTSNHIYHSGRGIDQYIGSGKLRKGENEILLKICQNEQEEGWAQDWQFQFRVCDELGTAIHSAESQTQRVN